MTEGSGNKADIQETGKEAGGLDGGKLGGVQPVVGGNKDDILTLGVIETRAKDPKADLAGVKLLIDNF